MDHAGQSLEPESLHAHFNEAVSVESISSEIKPSSVDIIGKEKLIELRLAILKKLFKRVEEIEKLGGEHCIPFFQVQTLGENEHNLPSVCTRLSMVFLMHYKRILVCGV